jgi:hypothetical protein
LPELGSINPYVLLPVVFTVSTVKIPDVTRGPGCVDGAVLPLVGDAALAPPLVGDVEVAPPLVEGALPPDEHAVATRSAAAETISAARNDSAPTLLCRVSLSRAT